MRRRARVELRGRPTFADLSSHYAQIPLGFGNAVVLQTTLIALLVSIDRKFLLRLSVGGARRAHVSRCARRLATRHRHRLRATLPRHRTSARRRRPLGNLPIHVGRRASHADRRARLSRGARFTLLLHSLAPLTLLRAPSSSATFATTRAWSTRSTRPYNKRCARHLASACGGCSSSGRYALRWRSS